MSIDLLQHKYKIILIFIIISQSKTSSTNVENQQKISEGSSIKYNALSSIGWNQQKYMRQYDFYKITAIYSQFK